jgi:peptidoglycan/xylan/chitin deacetylase (PgdA/CDA1 family)
VASVRETTSVRRLARPVLRALGVPLAALAARLLRLSARRTGVALVYHSLALQGGDPEVELVAPHQANLFEAEMRHLASTYRVVPAAELPHAVAARRRGERFPAAVTFDDDVASHADLALPILQRTGVHGTFFLTGTSLHNPFSFWWERLQRAVDSDERQLAELFVAIGAEPLPAGKRSGLHALGRLVERLEPDAREAFADSLRDTEGDPADAGLRADGVRALVEGGMSIGFHTRRHHPLPRLDEHALARAFEEGRHELESLAGERLTIVGYPHGRADERVAAAARSAGFETGYTGVPEPVRPDHDPLLLGRLNPSYRSVGHFALQIVATLLRARL